MRSSSAISEEVEAGMSAKTLAAFLSGVLVATTGTAAAVTNGHLFQLQVGDHAKYGTVRCDAVNVAPYSGFRCERVPGYAVIYGPSEIRVLRERLVNKRYVTQSIFHVAP
jgi:hypothetical protein